LVRPFSPVEQLAYGMSGARYDLEDRLVRFGAGICRLTESRRDFVHKLGICVKELRETRAWLKLIGEMSLCAEEQLELVITECDELLAILATSIRTARQNGRNSM
jgi:four helix bundle protein